jgi:hypothetical protein
MSKFTGITRRRLMALTIFSTLLPLSAQAELRPLKSVRGITFKQVQFVAPERKPLPALETAMRQAVPDYVNYIKTNPQSPARYYYNLVDLNGDGKPEAIVYPLGSYFCGTGGCTLMIFQPINKTYKLIGKIPLSHSPIIVTEQKTTGWKDLIRPTAGGGLPLNYSYLRYRQGKYTEGTEVPQNTAVKGQAVLGSDTPSELELKAK